MPSVRALKDMMTPVHPERVTTPVAVLGAYQPQVRSPACSTGAMHTAGLAGLVISAKRCG